MLKKFNYHYLIQDTYRNIFFNFDGNYAYHSIDNEYGRTIFRIYNDNNNFHYDSEFILVYKEKVFKVCPIFKSDFNRLYYYYMSKSSPDFEKTPTCNSSKELISVEHDSMFMDLFLKYLKIMGKESIRLKDEEIVRRRVISEKEKQEKQIVIDDLKSNIFS